MFWIPFCKLLYTSEGRNNQPPEKASQMLYSSALASVLLSVRYFQWINPLTTCYRSCEKFNIFHFQISIFSIQNNLFTSDCQYFHNEKTFVRTTEIKQCFNYKNCTVLKSFLALYSISLKLHHSQPIIIEKCFRVQVYY